VTLDGKNVELGLRDTLFRAHELREILDYSPLVTASLHRLILAILHRNFGPLDEREWVDLWKSKQFDKTTLEKYFVDWHHRFDLFDMKNPFFQVPGLKSSKLSTIARIGLECAEGDNDTLFDHSIEETAKPRPYSLAARWLVSIQNYALTGRLSSAYPVAGNLVKGVIILLKGQCLFETLLINLLIRSGELSTCIPSNKDDKPAWERDNITSCAERPVNGYLDYLTWQCRMVRLIPDANEPGTVRNIYLDAGYKIPKGNNILDPFFSFYCNDEIGIYPFSLSEYKAIWRDSDVLLERFSKQYRQPLSFAQLDSLIEKDIIEDTARYNIVVMGMNTKRAKINLWRHETMPLPLKYFIKQEFVGNLIYGVRLVEEACHCLKQNLKIISSKGNKVQHFWAMMEKPFFDFYTSIPDDPDSAIDIWWGAIRNNTWKSFDMEAQGVGDSALNMKSVVLARARLGAALKKLGPAKGGE